MIDLDRINRCCLVIGPKSSPAIPARSSFRNHRAAAAFDRSGCAVRRYGARWLATIGRADRIPADLDPTAVAPPPNCVPARRCERSAAGSDDLRRKVRTSFR